MREERYGRREEIEGNGGEKLMTSSDSKLGEAFRRGLCARTSGRR